MCYNSEEYRFERFWNKLQSRCAGPTHGTAWPDRKYPGWQRFFLHSFQCQSSLLWPTQVAIGTCLAPSVDRKLQCCKSFLLEFSDFHHLTANAASVKTFLIGKGDLKFWKFIFFGRENWHGQIYDMGKPYPQVIRENCLDGVCLPGKIPTMHPWEDFSTRNS